MFFMLILKVESNLDSQSEIFEFTSIPTKFLFSIERYSLRPLIVAKTKASKNYAQAIVNQLQHKTDPENQAIIELVSTVMVYKFPELSREAIEAMFSVSELKQTRVYQEALQEGEQAGEFRLVLRLLSRRIGDLSPEMRSASATKVVRRSKPYRHSN
jgi:histone deacetylase complex regulatory component SIN3